MRRVKGWPKWRRTTEKGWMLDSPVVGVYVLVPVDDSDFIGRSWAVWRGGTWLREVKQVETAKECARMDWEAQQGIVTYPRPRSL